MRAFLLAIVIASALGGGAWYLLEGRFQQTAENAFATTGVRL
jgi:hypothetical protein